MNSIEKKFWSKTLLNYNSTIFDAVKNLDNSGLRIVLVINNKNKLIGTLSDGDIRRALIKGYRFENTIRKIIKKNPITASTEDTIKFIRILMKKNSVLQIPIINKKNKICGLYILKEFEQKIKKKHKNKVFIMAGGFGTRLKPYTNKIPKPMLKIAGKPIIEHLLDIISSQGFKDIIFCLHHQKDIIKNFLKKKKIPGTKVSFIEEKKPLGTAGGLSLIKKKIKKPFLVLNADLIFDFELEDLINFHLQKKADSSILIKTFDIQNPYGVVKTNKNLVTKFTEKPIYQSSVNTGIYVLSPSVIKFLKKNEKISMVDFLKRLILKKKKVYAMNTSDSWKDIGTINQYSKYL